MSDNHEPLAIDHQVLWRPSPDFCGPLMPPMLLWFARGRPKSAWEVEADARHAAGVRRWEEPEQLNLFGGWLATREAPYAVAAE